MARQLIALVNQPVPLSLKHIANGSVGSPLLEQAMLMLSLLGTVEGHAPDLTGETLRAVRKQASRNSALTMLSLIQAIPVRRATINLGQASLMMSRMINQRQQVQSLIATNAPLPVAAPPLVPGPRPTIRTVFLPVTHRAEPLQLRVTEPQGGANGRLVLIPDGL